MRLDVHNPPSEATIRRRRSGNPFWYAQLELDRLPNPQRVMSGKANPACGHVDGVGVMTVLGRRLKPQRNGNLEAAGATAFRSGHEYLLAPVKGMQARWGG
jgi:hypothetical protein